MPSFLCISLFPTLAAGIALGYFVLFPALTSDGNPASGDSPKNTRPADFRQIRHSSAPHLPLPDAANTAALIQKYTDLTPRQTKEELIRLLACLKDDEKKAREFHYALRYLLNKLGSQSPEDAKQLLEDKAIPSYLCGELLESWAKTDFPGAMDYLLAHKKEMGNSLYLFLGMSRTLAKQDPVKVLPWLATLTEGERQTALPILAETLANNHPETIGPLLSSLSPEERKFDSLIYSLAFTWPASDFKAFKAWADTLEKEKRETAFRIAFGSLSKTDLKKATEEFRNNNWEERQTIAKAIVEEIRHREYSKGVALEWVLDNRSFLDDPLDLVRAAAAHSDAQTPEAMDKALKLPEGEIRDTALESMVTTRSFLAANEYNNTPAEEYFAEAMKLAAAIGDAEKRDKSSRECLSTWIRKFPETARPWITKEPGFSSQEKQKLLQACDDRQKEKNSH